MTETQTERGLKQGQSGFGHIDMSLVPPPHCARNSFLILTARDPFLPHVVPDSTMHTVKFSWGDVLLIND